MARGQTAACDAYDPVGALAEHANLTQHALWAQSGWSATRAIAVSYAINNANAGGLDSAAARLEATENITVACKLWSNFEGGASMVDPPYAGKFGGALYLAPSASAQISYSLFVGNRLPNDGSTHGWGGALYVATGASVHISYSSFVGNAADMSGGAVFLSTDVSADIIHSSFVGNDVLNTLHADGSAVFLSWVGAVGRISYSVFVGNRGSAAVCAGSHTSISYSTFIGNRAKNGGAVVAARSGLHLSNSTFIWNQAQLNGDHIYASSPIDFYVINTQFDPFVDDARGITSVYLDVLATCQRYPCPLGFGCSYVNYSLFCTACRPPLVGRDGIQCVLEFTCAAGTECTATGGCTDQSMCTMCRNGTVSSGSGECTACSRLGERANDARTACIPCPPGTEPSLDRTQCVPCGEPNQFSEGVSCKLCAPPGTTPTSVPNEQKSACVPCTAGTKPSAAGDECICDSSHYNATLIAIRCYEDSFEEAATLASSSTGCARCGSCLDCEGLPKVRPGYVRLNPTGILSTDDYHSLATHATQVSPAQQPVVATIPVFRCKSVGGCYGGGLTDDPNVVRCQQNYTGMLCESCEVGYEHAENGRGCQACSTSATKSWIVVLLVAAGIAAVAKVRHRLARAIASNTATVASVLAVARSAWQPIRIAVSYAQVTSQVGASLNVQYPPTFAALANKLAGFLDVIDGVLGAQCLGLDDFHTQWLTQVVLLPLGLTAAAFGVFEVERRRSSRDTARKHLAGNVFFIAFVCYPRVCQVSFNAWICRRVLPDLSVLVADDRVACDKGSHVIYQWLSLAVLVVIALGVPVAAMIVLYREKQAQPEVDESLKLRTAEALAITPEEAEFAVNDIRLGSSYGFLVDAYKPDFFYWESMDMLRKLALLGLILLFERGSVNQIAVSLFISFFFMVAHVHAHPYKLASDNYFRTATELHVFLTIATGLIFRTDIDNSFASQMVAQGALNVDDDVRRLYEKDEQARKSGYDSLLLVTFIFLVAGAIVATIVAKMLVVARAVASLSDQGSAVEGSHEVLMRAAYARFRLGLATGSDHADLVDFIGQLGVNQHVSAGKRLWREKMLVSHFTAANMETLLRDIEQQLPKSEAIAYHFTDLDAARVILDQSQGLRASTVGQLGGGVSVCLASPVVLGWDKHGGEGMTFCKRIGEELWGSKAHEVFPGVPPAGAHQDYGKFHNKLEVLLLVRIPAAQNRDRSRVVPGRDNVYIIDNRDCQPGIGTDTARYYSNLNIERCLVLKSPATEADRNKLDTLASRPQDARVKVQSSRTDFNEMAEVMVKEVESTERIDDDLTQLGNWCPAVTTFTATVPCPSNGASTVRHLHQTLHQRRRNHVVWPENIARFTVEEMAAALHSVEQSMPHCYTMAFHYTSAANAKRMCKDGKGIDTVETAGVVIASLRSPVHLGWQKNSGGHFKETAGFAIWGPQWRQSHVDQMQAVLVIGIPTEELPENPGASFPISEALLATEETTGTRYYANAHVCKSYLLDPDASCTKSPATDIGSAEHDELAKLFAKVDVDGDGQITTDEAMQYIREDGFDLDEQSIINMFNVLDSSGRGTIDLSDFPRLMDAIRQSAPKAATPNPQPPRPVESAAPGATLSRSGTSMQSHNNWQEASPAAVLFEQVDKDGSGLISFDEFLYWWSHRQLSTGGSLDEAAATEVQQQWNELDTDGSGSIDKEEFEALMTKLATLEWKEAFDSKRQKVYYYNTRTKATRWCQPDAEAAVADFMAANGLTALRPPPALEALRPRNRGGNAAAGATTTTNNPLSTTPVLPSSRVDTFDVEVPPPIDSLQRRSEDSKAKMHSSRRPAAPRANAATVAGTRRALPRRPLPRRSASQRPPHISSSIA